jgi:protein TorT
MMMKRKESFSRKIVVVVIASVVVWGLTPLAVIAEDVAEGIQVNAYYGVYDATLKKQGFPSPSLKEPVIETWQPPVPKKSYHIAALVPHHNDSYWVTVNYAYMTHAKELGVTLSLYEAGSYANFGNQREQLTTLAQGKHVDGIILSSVDYAKMDRYVEMAVDKGVPVVNLINDIRAPKIYAKSQVSFYDMGYEAGRFVIRDSEGKDVKIALFPGPEQSGWAPESYEGFKAAVLQLKHPDQQVTLLDPAWGNTSPEVQYKRLMHVLNDPANAQMDYIVGCAVAATEAVKYLKDHSATHPNAKIVSTYITGDVYDQIRQNAISAAPCDQIIPQTSIALDMMVRILNGEQPGKDFPFLASPVILTITEDNIAHSPYETILGKKEYAPVIHRLEE